MLQVDALKARIYVLNSNLANNVTIIVEVEIFLDMLEGDLEDEHCNLTKDTPHDARSIERIIRSWLKAQHTQHNEDISKD